MSALDDLRRALEAEAAQRALTPEVVTRVVQSEFGGMRVYIGSKPLRPAANSRLTPKQIAELHGVSRSHAYKL
ncbi:MAG: hypothetical protein ACLFS2_10155, partial [Halochromatium sp.]|uniref:hypothetical protein n=1 Tax=Halochromatium sp. TaxID=2049430 RepID=UPI00397D5110